MKDEIKEILETIIEEKLENLPCTDMLDSKQASELLDYITNLQKENQRLNKQYDLMEQSLDEKQEVIDKAIEYITSYEAISTIQGLDKIEQNTKLDERTMNVMVERYLKVHHNLLNILQGEDKDE